MHLPTIPSQRSRLLEPCSAQTLVCATATGFSDVPVLHAAIPRVLRAWDFPLSRTEKVSRLLWLYEAEVQGSRVAMEQWEREVSRLVREREALQFSRRVSARGSEIDMSASADPREEVDAMVSIEGTTERSRQTRLNHHRRSEARTASRILLKPSLKATLAMRDEIFGDGIEHMSITPCHGLHPVQELQHSNAAITCLCFGQQTRHRAYVLLAAASCDGMVAIYRSYRTEMEAAMLPCVDFHDGYCSSRPEPADHAYITLHSRLVGHTHPVTTAFFNQLGDQLVTASVDKTIRFWDVAHGKMLRVFVASSAVTAAVLLPLHTQALVAATSGVPVLRLIDAQRGHELRALRFESTVQALAVDRTCRHLLAGTTRGDVHVLEVSYTGGLDLRFGAKVTPFEVSCIRFIPRIRGRPAQILVGTSASSLVTADCDYGTTGALLNLVVRHSVQVAPSPARVSCCYSESDHGYVLAGSETGDICISPLLKSFPSNEEPWLLKHHGAATLAVTVNLQDTLLASGDASGRIVFWRRLDCSHLSN